MRLPAFLLPRCPYYYQVISNLLNYRLVGIVLGSLLGFAGAYVFTTALRFYNRAYSIDETFENQQEERGVL